MEDLWIRLQLGLAAASDGRPRSSFDAYMTVFIFMNRVRTSINLDIIMADNPSSGDSSISYKWPFFILYCSGGLCGIAYAAYSSFKKVES